MLNQLTCLVILGFACAAFAKLFFEMRKPTMVLEGLQQFIERNYGKEQLHIDGQDISKETMYLIAGNVELIQEHDIELEVNEKIVPKYKAYTPLFCVYCFSVYPALIASAVLMGWYEFSLATVVILPSLTTAFLGWIK